MEEKFSRKIKMELYYELTSNNNKTFDEGWSSFMFNMEKLKILKMLKSKLIDEVLLAGRRFLGMGWSPERARDRLLQLSGYFLV